MELLLDRRSSLPAYMQIRNHLREQILQGEISPGTRLPPERELARRLGVSRTTVVSAYDELTAEGLVEAHRGRGTTVLGPAAALGETVQPIAWPVHFSSLAQRLRGPASAEMSALRDLSAQPGVLSFATGTPDPTLTPRARFHEAWAAVLQQVGVEALASSPIQGIAPLRDLIVERMAQRGIVANRDNVVVVSGSQQGLDILVRLLTEPGDTVVAEAPTYYGALQTFQAQGLRVIGIPVDAQGMDVDSVEQTLTRYRPRLIYTIPNYQNPTGVTLSPNRRAKLLELSQRYGVPIIEDDPFGDLPFQGPPPTPIKALDPCGHVIYLSTFSKSLAPGLRIGWFTGPRPVVEMAILLKRVVDLQANSAGQYLVVEFARRGWLAEGIAAARSVYGRRCAAMDAGLQAHLPDGACWAPPQGGLFLWLELPELLSAHRLLTETGAQGVVFLPGSILYPSSGPRNGCRLNFSARTEAQIAQGTEVMGRALAKLVQGQASANAADSAASAVV
ncbi:MAG: PLP-dependent aminotransferase family protein [Chloroflexi bacterium]|nr:PLP-dependent aminotransferase family protein [Chloroflexota bacterium]